MRQQKHPPCTTASGKRKTVAVGFAPHGPRSACCDIGGCEENPLLDRRANLAACATIPSHDTPACPRYPRIGVFIVAARH